LCAPFCFVEHVGVDEDIVLGDFGQERGDVADAAHIGSQVVDFINVARDCETVFPDAQIADLEIVGRGLFVFGHLDVGAAHPVAIFFQPLDQVVADEPARSGHKNSFLICHCDLLPR